MILKYDLWIQEEAIDINLKRLTNQTYKLLPLREEGGDWRKPLHTIIEELAGMDRVLFEQHSILFKLICKLEGLFTLNEDADFMLYRGVIFECLGLLSDLQKACQDQIL